VTSNAIGSSSVTKSGYITVSNSVTTLVAAFSADPTSGSAPLNVSFTDASTGSPTSWKWYFSDGTTSTDQNPVHTFSKPGLYSVSLAASNTIGSSSMTKSNFIYVTNSLNAPVAAFSANQTSGSAPLKVSFNANSTGSATSWQWYFGEYGTNTTDQNPVHTYYHPGLYTVILTARNAWGSVSVSKPNYIYVKNDFSVPVAAFSASPTSGNAPLNVSFTDASTGSPTLWKWYFSDGTNSTDQNPVHTFSKPGLYFVTLTAGNGGGSSSVTKSSYIAVSNSINTPVAAFSASPTSGSAPLNVSFTDASTGSPTSWKWYFSDGTTSTDQNPVHTFSKPGLYSVSLAASNAIGSSSMTKSSYITVSNSLTAPVAAFSADPISGSSPLNVSFTDASAGSPTSWKWYFSDGTNTTDQNPVHTFSKAGLYNVGLTVNNPGGSSAITISRYITVK
jgi:PKD repeat protein